MRLLKRIFFAARSRVPTLPELHHEPVAVVIGHEFPEFTALVVFNNPANILIEPLFMLWLDLLT